MTATVQPTNTSHKKNIPLPALRKADITVTVAAMPVATQHAPAAPSNPATFASSAETVGLAVREYEKPLSCDSFEKNRDG